MNKIYLGLDYITIDSATCKIDSYLEQLILEIICNGHSLYFTTRDSTYPRYTHYHLHPSIDMENLKVNCNLPFARVMHNFKVEWYDSDLKCNLIQDLMPFVNQMENNVHKLAKKYKKLIGIL